MKSRFSEKEKANILKRSRKRAMARVCAEVVVVEAEIRKTLGSAMVELEQMRGVGVVRAVADGRLDFGLTGLSVPPSIVWPPKPGGIR